MFLMKSQPVSEHFLPFDDQAILCFSLLDRSDDQKRAWLALLTRKRHDETMEQVCDVIIELEPRST